MITAAGGTDRIVLRESPDPVPRGREVRIRARASGVNFADILARQGLYPDVSRFPAVVGYEVSGTVDAVGPEADPRWVGRDVVGLTHFGGYADTVCVPQEQVFEKPATLSHEQAAALPVTYLAAWQLMVVMGSLSAGDTVLIHNAGGGVGLAALDIGRHIGARMIGTASARKHAFLAERGLHEAIDYTTQDWTKEVMRLTGGRGVELVLDPFGGHHWRRSYRMLRPTGRLGMFSVSGAVSSRLPGKLGLLALVAQQPLFNPIPLMNRNLGVFGVNLGHLFSETEKVRGWMEALLEGVDEGWVRPHVDRTFPLAEAGDAHAYLEARRNIGKVVLVP
ncbi:oxidoreductase [Sinomonas cyclohexanicum]|uniref:Oxidoreductase n=1 Tax=Sinomonas cyclohexanicum TaxID=322009 RepID=A0ABM7Q0W0_SINCY|nr:oxidoreductase [Corynebacterium cyclohexanicum]